MKRDFFPDNFLGGEDLELEPQTIHGTFVLAKIHKKSRRKNWDRFQSPRRSRNQNFSLNFLLFPGGSPPPQGTINGTHINPFGINTGRRNGGSPLNPACDLRAGGAAVLDHRAKRRPDKASSRLQRGIKAALRHSTRPKGTPALFPVTKFP